MKKIFIVFIFIPLWIFSQSNYKFCEQLQAEQILLQENHYHPKPLDKKLSDAVYGLFLTALDEDKEFLTQEDVLLLNQDKTKIHQYIRNNDCSFSNKYGTVLENNINYIIDYLETLKEDKLQYSNSEVIRFRKKENRKFFKNKTDLLTYWNKRIRYYVLKKYVENYSKNLTVSFEEIAPQLKIEIIDNQLCYLNERLHFKGNIQNFVNYSFLNALANYNDPHSSFFTFSEKQFFENVLVSAQQSFGIITNKNKFGEIIIKKVIVGSPAFKNGNIQKNDKIVELTSNNDVLSISCISNADVISFLNNISHKKIKISIIKSNGKQQEIVLEKEKVENEDNAIHSYVLGENFKVGYIQIPSFYTDSESIFGKGIANDVAKEVFRLQRAHIEALIINLRYNGGGSLKEAIELSGLFIDKGPVSILKFNDGHLSTLKDLKRGTLFTKPIAILVNSQSASASELFAGTLQDYHRAIIIGSATFGKASAQTFLPLSAKKNMGFCKITGEKFYRINGKSNQQIGVQPDIVLPSFYDGFEIGENYLPYFLKNDSIINVLDYKSLTPINFKLIREKSKKRVLNSPKFAQIKQLNIDFLKNYKKDRDYSIPLTIKNVEEDLSIKEEIFDRFKKIKDDNSQDIPVVNTKSYAEFLSYNPEKFKMNKNDLEDISKNIYIIEAYHILNDLKKQKQ